VALEVRYSEEAEEDLVDTYVYIAERDGIERAEAVDKRLRAACETLADFPNRGSPHDELAAGLRSLPFKRRATIYYRVTAETVDIMHIAWAGRDAAGIFKS
jgi:toxin ParE1/3/4